MTYWFNKCLVHHSQRCLRSFLLAIIAPVTEGISLPGTSEIGELGKKLEFYSDVSNITLYCLSLHVTEAQSLRKLLCISLSLWDCIYIFKKHNAV